MIPNASPVLSVRVSQSERDLLEMAAEQARTNLSDFIRRKALEAAIRNENDLLALLPDDLPATSTPQRTTEENGAQPTHAAA